MRANFERPLDDDLDSQLERLASPETLLPAQLEARLDLDSPERRLWRAVLRDALADLDSPSRSRRLDAREWIELDSFGWASFRWICDIFHINQRAVRATLSPRRAAQ